MDSFCFRGWFLSSEELSHFGGEEHYFLKHLHECPNTGMLLSHSASIPSNPKVALGLGQGGKDPAAQV